MEPTGNRGGNWKINEDDGAISDTVTLVRLDGFLDHCLESRTVDVRYLCSCCRHSWWYDCGRSVDISDAGFLACVETRASWSVSAVHTRLIKFHFFIFHSSAVSGSTSAITLLDSVQLTALGEPKLRADHVLFWCRSPEQSCLNANTLGGVSVGLNQVSGEKHMPSSSLAQTRVHS